MVTKGGPWDMEWDIGQPLSAQPTCTPGPSLGLPQPPPTPSFNHGTREAGKRGSGDAEAAPGGLDAPDLPRASLPASLMPWLAPGLPPPPAPLPEDKIFWHFPSVHQFGFRASWNNAALPQPSTSGNSCPVTPPPQSVHPSVSIGNIQVFTTSSLLLPAVATLPEAAVSDGGGSVGARPSRLLEKEGKKTGGVNPTSMERRGAQKGS
ncbi:hypothetical protein E2320_006395 [Naja naja]|nr:hypothetical protein E2320_006395 [Naja naja]